MLTKENINLDKLIIELSNQGFNSGATPIKDVALLLHLIYMTSLGSIVEIGTHKGETTQYLAKYNMNRFVYSIDCIDPSILSEEQKKENPSFDDWGKFTKDIPNVLLINHNSHLLKYDMLVNPTFVFIDGDHTYKGVSDDAALAIHALTESKELVKIIAFHDFWVNRDHKDCPWVGVTDFVTSEIAPKFNVRYCEGTNICYIIL